MAKLTTAQLNALRQIDRTDVIGPAPGWNADCEMFTPEGMVDGAELAPLFERGLISTRPAPEPHKEDFNEESGSITLDSIWSLTPAGRSAITKKEGQ